MALLAARAVTAHRPSITNPESPDTSPIAIRQSPTIRESQITNRQW
jgi:hypothetical protein